MTIQAQFLDIKWEISEQKVMGIETINYSFGVNTETKSSSGGNDKVVLKGYKADGITVSYKANRMFLSTMNYYIMKIRSCAIWKRNIITLAHNYIERVFNH